MIQKKTMLTLRNGVKTVKRCFQLALKRSAHREHKVPVGNVNINIVEAGHGEKSVLLMPGACGSAWTDFKPQIEKLPDLLPNHTIIAWDPPGYGKSIPPQREFGLKFYENDAKSAIELMKTLNRPKFSIMGWSDGGITGLIMTSRYAPNIEKLVIWGSNAYVAKSEVDLIGALRDVSKMSANAREPMEKVYGVENFAKLWRDWVDAYVAIYHKNNGDICIADAENIHTPTFILHGKKDAVVAPEHIPFLRERIKDHKYFEFPNGKHNIHLRYADEFNKLVTDFLLDQDNNKL